MIFEQPTIGFDFYGNGGLIAGNTIVGGIKRVKRIDISGSGSTHFYRELETNAERLCMIFPQKDKLNLMKLLEDLDNRVEIAHDILVAEALQVQTAASTASPSSSKLAEDTVAPTLSNT